MADFLNELQISAQNSGTFQGKWSLSSTAKWLSSVSPIDGKEIAQVSLTSTSEYEEVIQTASETFLRWRCLPAPKRGEIIRQIGVAFREHKKALGLLISTECGKILAEAEGEVQEVIDIADFAVGLSRQLYGLSMHSERPRHRMYEQWHPLGVIGVISAFNFPVAVWAWNAMIAAVCGDTVVWKPAGATPLTAVAATKICEQITSQLGYPGLFTLVNGSGKEIGRSLCSDKRVPLISATGSCAMGKEISAIVAQRFGRSLLELGGNNAIIALKDCDMELAARAIFFGAVGTAGQRCTTTRRLLVEQPIADELTKKLIHLYKQVKIGDPRQPGTLMGPLISAAAVNDYQRALKRIPTEGGEVLYGGNVLSGYPSSNYVEPTLVLAKPDMPLLREETFAPILYVVPVGSLKEAIDLNNGVPQGLSSAIFTRSFQGSEEFLSAAGSDCGIANVNVGTSGAEIGGAFGGEKETGGGREAGSDAWKAYMRRQTCTLNWSDELPLAQGIKFGG